MTSLLPHFSWLLHLSIGNQKLFQTNYSESCVLAESKAKCHSSFSWLLDPNKCIRWNCSKFGLTLGYRMPFQGMGPTHMSQTALPNWQHVPSVSDPKLCALPLEHWHAHPLLRRTYSKPTWMSLTSCFKSSKQTQTSSNIQAQFFGKKTRCATMR